MEFEGKSKLLLVIFSDSFVESISGGTSLEFVKNWDSGHAKLVGHELACSFREATLRFVEFCDSLV